MNIIHLVITTHRLEFSHEFDWKNINILDNKKFAHKRLTSEMIFIKKQINDLNIKNDMESLDVIYSNLFTKTWYFPFLALLTYYILFKLCLRHMRTKNKIDTLSVMWHDILLCKFNLSVIMYYTRLFNYVQLIIVIYCLILTPLVIWRKRTYFFFEWLVLTFYYV